MADLANLPSLREVADSHGLRARRSLGQHFLFDDNLLDRIARTAGDLSTVTTLEIGAGHGGLTRALLRAGATRIVAIEKDRRCLAALRDLVDASAGRLRAVEAAALACDVAALGDAPRAVVGNLPFNIATELLMRLIGTLGAADRMVLMFQKEVGERLAARPGSRSYGRLSAMVQWSCVVEPCFDVPPRAFVPPPKVAGRVLAIAPRPEPVFPAPRHALSAVTAAAFGQRRKTLRNSLKSLFDDAEAALEAAGVDPGARAGEIDLEGFCALAREAAARNVGRRGEEGVESARRSGYIPRRSNARERR